MDFSKILLNPSARVVVNVTSPVYTTGTIESVPAAASL
jgi:hypothetical protein